MTHSLKVAVALATVWSGAAAAADSPASAWRDLLDSQLSNFDVYLSYRGDQIMSVLKGTAPPDLKPVGLNPPGQDVFTVSSDASEHVLRVSGEYYGCLVTRQSFSNYHFRVQFKWGDKKWEPRLNEPRDSGILYHSRGDFGVDYWKSWALSHEFQIIEHGLGEYWTQATSAMDLRALPKKPGEEAPRWNENAPWMVFASPNNHALAGSDEERPGEWNQLELICQLDRCLHVVNGKVVMALKNARYQDADGKWVPMTDGKLQFQSEAAEIFYRRFQIRSIDGPQP
ncbi:MAG TPA: DUF1080 domain-containing protein [Steroidobacteraceae bacterium]|jgi:hypothetical protein